jgi:hypothetical protein
MDNINYAHEIVKTLEDRGNSKDYIIGFLQATLDGIKHLDDTNLYLPYLKNTLKQAQQSDTLYA